MFKAKAFIRDKKMAEELQCTICYEISADIVRCQGPCHKTFCLKCVSRAKYKQGPCPNRCSQIFQIEPLPGVDFTFDCPFAQRGCKRVLQNETEFEEHYKICEFMSEHCKKQLHHILNYECPLGHRLTFLTEEVIQKVYGVNNYYFIFMNEQCSSCFEVTLCRSICMQCTKPEKKACFCTRCRELPCTKIKCPIGHYLQLRTQFSYTLTCDLCGLSGIIFGNQAYEDIQCNFDICHRCYQKLKETHPLIPLDNSIEEYMINEYPF